MYNIRCIGHEAIIESFQTIEECKNWINEDIQKARQKGIYIDVHDYIIQQEGIDNNYNDMMSEEEYNAELSEIYDSDQNIPKKKKELNKKFNQSNYIKEYQKQNYKQFKVFLKKEEKEELDKLLKEKNMTKAQFLKNAIKDYLKK